VRNSGVNAVVEGVGDHGCEYMTGGVVVILGRTGRNFAAGMSGGIAYVYDELGDFASLCNSEMVGLEQLDDSDAVILKEMIEKHAGFTGSSLATMMLVNWQNVLSQFVKVMPRDYKRVLQALERAKATGLSGDDALAAAFEENSHIGEH
jgi:glutamate synthase (ferredoxin)